MPTSPLAPLLQHLRRAASPIDGGLTDGQLLDAFVTARDEVAFEALVGRHGPMVLGVCRRILRDSHDAEDAFQATFLVLARKAASVVPREMVGNWLYGVACRTASKAKSLAARRREKERQVRQTPRPEPLDPDTRDDLQARLDRELERLPANYRAAVVLCDLEGKSRHEAAVQLGLPEGTLSSRLARGRSLLARRLAGRGTTLSAGAVAVTLSQCAAPAAVPPSLMTSTVKAGVLVAAGQVAAAVVPAKVVAITEGVLHAMFLDKLKALLTLALAVVVVGVGSIVPTVSLMSAPAEPAAPVAPVAPMAPVATQDEPAKAGKKEQPKPGQKEKKPAPGGNARVEEVLRKSFVTKKAPRLVVDTFNGHIEVKIGAEGVTNAKVVRSTQAETLVAAWEDLKSVDVQMTQEADTIRVTAKPKGEQKQTNRAAAVEVEVPPGATLDLRGSNGGVTVTGATRDVAVVTSNGGVEVTGSKGALRLKTNNGGIRVDGGAGPLVLNTTNGSIDVKAAKAKVEAKTSNGSIRFTGSLTAGGHTFTTSNGNVVVALPAGTRFRLDAQTSLGQVTCQFPHEPSKEKRKTRLQTSVGDNPAINLKLRTSQGNIEVRPEQPRQQ